MQKHKRGHLQPQGKLLSLFADVGYDEESSIAAETAEAAPAQGDVRRVEYSAEMAEIGFPA